MKRYIICLITLMCAVTVSAQTAKQAEKLFNAGEYEKAKTAYQRLVRTAPSNAGYNFFLGASLYELGEKEEALPYLEKSAKRKYINAFRYLGKLYADMYRYEDAIDNYETHIEWLEEKNRDTSMAEEELNIIRQHARMMKGTEKVTVIDSFVVDKKNFLDTYRLSKVSGRLVAPPEITGTLYENEMENKRIYADISADNQMQLYSQVKLLDGWDKGEPLTSLNDMGNVDYPFLMGDGTTLYFASDCEGTLGGYDIFITRYDSEDNEYLKPSNVGMPFNSTANDYMMAIDEYNQLGWFATDRNQPKDSVCIYVFIPNESKRTYNYENTELQTMIDAATLRNISTTWEDMDVVNAAKKRLAEAMTIKEDKGSKKSFTFIINDKMTYHDLNQFRSAEARKLYTKLTGLQKDMLKMETNLKKMRDKYAKGNAQVQKQLTPSILKMEKQLPALHQEVEELTIQVRNLEIEKITKK